jgi:hypothetical protein
MLAAVCGLFEIPQIRRRLVLLRRHQQAFGAQVVGLLADADMDIVLGTDVLAPPDRLVGDESVIGPLEQSTFASYGPPPGRIGGTMAAPNPAILP